MKTNREFSKTDRTFVDACKLVKTGKLDESGNEITLKPSVRQASKFRHGKGSAYKAMVKIKARHTAK